MDEKFKELKKTWSQMEVFEPSARWRTDLFRKLRENRSVSFLELLAEWFPKAALLSAACALVLIFISELPGINEEDDLSIVTAFSDYTSADSDFDFSMDDYLEVP